MNTLKVYPAEGACVIDPATGLRLTDEGLTVERNSFWLRRIEDGSVTTGKEKATPAPKQKEA